MTSIDLRSDTVTRPGPGMRRAMFEAEVGDDVFGDDPTIHQLEQRVARTLGKAAALYVPSGTMANQLAVRAQTEPGDQLLLESDCHVFNYEAGAPAALSGVMPTPLKSVGGALRWADIEAALHPDDPHYTRPSLVCLENTHNRSGGCIVPLDVVDEVTTGAHERSLRVHLDGARLWNAAIASGIEPSRWARDFDSVSVCFSKGMGAPVGSVLAADAETIRRARRFRKQWGGGMRQAGFLAAACLYALDQNYERLEQDHAKARDLAQLQHPALRLVAPPQTNIVLFDVSAEVDAAGFLSAMADVGVLAGAMGPRRIRMVTHLDVSVEDCVQAVERIGRLRV